MFSDGGRLASAARNRDPVASSLRQTNGTAAEMSGHIVLIRAFRTEIAAKAWVNPAERTHYRNGSSTIHQRRAPAGLSKSAGVMRF